MVKSVYFKTQIAVSEFIFVSYKSLHTLGHIVDSGKPINK